MKHFTHALCALSALMGAQAVRADTLDLAPASPATACRFVQVGSVMHLVANCTTEATIVIPDGMTLDGAGHRIRAVDPPAGSFEGAVIRNGGRSAHVRRVEIEASELSAVCHASAPLDRRLRGILFDAASGSITDNRIVAMRQEGMPCQEGHGIDVRTDVGAVLAERPNVLVRGNSIMGFQKTGILVLGDVDVSVYLNRVEGAGTLPNIAQNAMQIGRGARGTIKWNVFSSVHYGGDGFSAVGLLVQDIEAPLSIAFNRIDDSDVGVWLERSSNVDIEANDVRRALAAGVVIGGISDAATDNRVVGNRIASTGAGVLLVGAEASDNLVERNIIRALDESVQEAAGAHDNTIVHNSTPAPCEDKRGER